MQRKETIVSKESKANIPTKHLEFWMAALEAAGFEPVDLGERITTEDGIDAEAVLSVTLRVRQPAARAVLVA